VAVSHTKDDDSVTLQKLTSVSSDTSEPLSTPSFDPRDEEAFVGAGEYRKPLPSATESTVIPNICATMEDEKEDEKSHHYPRNSDLAQQLTEQSYINLSARTRKDSMSYGDIPGSCYSEDLRLSPSKSESCLNTSEKKPSSPQHTNIEKIKEMARRERQGRGRTDSTQPLLRGVSQSSETGEN
jgi:hypothetical protein